MSQTTDQISVPAPERPEKRFAIVGTAGSWKKAPWNDPHVTIAGLNDGYMLGARLTGQRSLPRADLWYDLHPFHHMAFRSGQTVDPRSVPVGVYLRPEGHLEWLRSRPFPVYLADAPKDWPNARTFPREELEKKYGTYFSSTPAWMLVHMLEMGATQIEIYGINLATEWEYVSQRPNFEFLLGLAAARGVKIVLPEGCPLLQSKHKYAYEPKHDLPAQAAQMRVSLIKMEGAQLQQQLQAAKFYHVGRRKDLQARLDVLNLELADAKQAQQRVQLALM